MHASLKSYDLIKTFGASSRRGDAALALCTLVPTVGGCSDPGRWSAHHVCSSCARDRIFRRAASWLLHDLQARFARCPRRSEPHRMVLKGCLKSA